MKNRVMTGAAMYTERLTDRAGEWVSPARMAMYSKPENAPTASLPRMLRLNNDRAGISVRKGWNDCRWPVARPRKGSRISTPKIVIMKTPPALWTHLPSDRPTNANQARSAIASADARDTNQALRVIQAALGPSAYDR